MKILLTYEGTDADQLTRDTWNWAENEEIPSKDAEEILDMIRSGEIWRQMDGIPTEWRILAPDADDAEFKRSDYLIWVTAYEQDADGDYDWEKPLAKSKRYVIEFEDAETKEAYEEKLSNEDPDPAEDEKALLTSKIEGIMQEYARSFIAPNVSTDKMPQSEFAAIVKKWQLSTGFLKIFLGRSAEAVKSYKYRKDHTIPADTATKLRRLDVILDSMQQQRS